MADAGRKMSETEMKQLNDVKTIIRGLLVSTAHTMTVRNLEKDYRETEGRDIPLFGHPDILSFIRSIPDACLLEKGRPYQGTTQYYIKPVLGAEIKHIDNLVMRQRSSKGMAKFGIPRRTAGVMSTSAQRSRSSPPPSTAVSRHRHRDHSHDTLSRHSPERRSRQQNYGSHEMDHSPERRSRQQNYGSHEMDHSSERRSRQQSNGSQKIYHGREEPTNNQPYTKAYVDQPSQNASNESAVVLRQQEQYQVTAKKRTFGEVEETCQITKQACYVETLNSRTNRLPETANIIGHLITKGVVICTPEDDTEIRKREEVKRIKKNTENQIPLQVKWNLKNLVSKHKGGIQADDFVGTYERHFRECLDVTRFGCANIKEFLACQSEDLLKLTVNNGLVKVYPGLEVVREWEKQPPLYPLNSAPQMDDKLRDLLNNVMPENVVCLGQNLATFLWPMNAVPGKMVPISPCQIYHPQHFYFQFMGVSYKKKLEACMKDHMQEFYRQQGDKLKCKTLYQGLYIVCLYDAAFHRAVITEVLSEKSCKIFYIDYGTTEEKMLDQLYYLNRMFIEVAPQACIGTLYNVKPSNKHWSSEAVIAMLQLLENSKSYAWIKAVDKGKNQIVMNLVIEKNYNYVLVNNELVRLGFAEFVDISKCQQFSSVANQHQRALGDKHEGTFRPQETCLHLPPPQITFPTPPREADNQHVSVKSGKDVLQWTSPTMPKQLAKSDDDDDDDIQVLEEIQCRTELQRRYVKCICLGDKKQYRLNVINYKDVPYLPLEEIACKVLKLGNGRTLVQKLSGKLPVNTFVSIHQLENPALFNELSKLQLTEYIDLSTKQVILVPMKDAMSILSLFNHMELRSHLVSAYNTFDPKSEVWYQRPIKNEKI